MEVDWARYDAALFDLDGVITPTAEVHMHAWETMFTDFFNTEGIKPPYRTDDYFAYVDGRPRYEGVSRLLASRHVVLPEGEPSDDPTVRSIAGLGNRKNEVFASILEKEGVQAYPGSVSLLDYLATVSMPMAIVSSSRNARAVLNAAGLLDRFAFVIDGEVAASRGLAGKPAPDTFVAAAKDLNADVSRTIVFEDAISGVTAARAGDFGLVIGVNRGAGTEELLTSGADVVVEDLAELI